MPRFIDVDQTLSAAAGFDARRSIGVAGTRVVGGTGIDLTGATDSSAAFQAILNSASAAAAAGSGVVEVYIPPGTLSLTTGVTVGAGVTVRGAGLGATTITSSYAPGSGLGVLQLNGASDITVADLTIEATAGGSNSIGISGGYNGLQSRVSVTNCRITGTMNNAVRFPYAVKYLTFSDNLVDDCEAGFVTYAPTVASGLVSSGWIISNNRFSDVGSVNIGLYGGTNPLTTSTVVGVEISGNDLRDFKQTGGAGPIPIEPTCVTNIVIANNVIDGTATNGISTGSNINMVCTGNTIRNQSNYAFELNGGRQLVIVGNIAENCRTFASQTNDLTAVPLADVLIADNTIIGSGQTTSQTVEHIKLRYVQRARIAGNIFKDWQYLRCAIRLGDEGIHICEDVTVEGNTFVATSANTKIIAINVASAIRTSVVRNTFRVNRNLAAGDNFLSVVMVAQINLTADTLIEGNHIAFTGTIGSAPDASGIGNGNAAAGVCAGLVVRRNHILDGPRGIRLMTNSADLVVHDNDTSTCTTADGIPTTYFDKSRVTSNVTDGSTALTGTSRPVQVFTGSVSENVYLPTTSIAEGQQFTIITRSSAQVVVRSSGGNAITTLTGGTQAAAVFIALKDNPTAATDWQALIS